MTSNNLTCWETNFYHVAYPLIIFGTSSLAEIALEYFSKDSAYKVVAFTVNNDYMDKTRFNGRPIIPFEKIENYFPSNTIHLFIAVGYDEGLNDLRAKIYTEAKSKGYAFANYISSRSFVWDNVKIGDNVFIMEDNTIQPFVTIGNNNIFWSGNHIGHHSKIGDNNFFSSHVVVCGHVTVGNNCFFGVNSSVANNITIPDRTFIKMGGIATKDYIYEMGKKRPCLHS